MGEKSIYEKSECPVCHRMEYCDWWLFGAYRCDRCYFDYIYAMWDRWRILGY